MFWEVINAEGAFKNAIPAFIDLSPLDISTSFISVPSIYFIASIVYSTYPEVLGAVTSKRRDSIVLPSLNI